MYNTGNAGFLAAACSINRTINTLVKLTVNGSVWFLSPDSIVSYKIFKLSTGGKIFAPGSFVASQLELSLNSSSSELNYIDFKNSTVDKAFVIAQIKVSDRMVDVPMGDFYPDADGVSAGDDGLVSIKATDIPPVLLGRFTSSTLTFPCTVQSVLDKISADTGLDFDITAADFPNLGVELTETFILESTYRDALMYISEVLGAYVQMGRDGKICVKRCFTGLVDIGCTLDENYLFSVSKQENSVKPFQYISIKANKDDLGVTQTVEGVNTECEYSILDNPLTYGHPDDFLSGLIPPLNFTEFYPSKISFHGRPDLDTGDVVEYVYKGVTYTLPICSHVFEYNGGFKTTLESIGTSALKVSSVDSGTKTQIQALKQKMNVLIRDLTQTQSQIAEINGDITEISTLLQTVEAIKLQVSKIEGNLEKVSTLTQTAEQFRIDIETIVTGLKDTNDKVNSNQEVLLSYFDFLADGLVIGVSNSNIKLKLANNKIYFLKDDTQEVAYFSEGKLYVRDAHFLNSLVLGNFEFVPRNNGNLSLRYREQEV